MSDPQRTIAGQQLGRLAAAATSLIVSGAAVAIALTTPADSSSPSPSPSAAPASAPSVHVPSNPSPSGDVKISFRPHGRLPGGGYYYAVVVLDRYRGYSVSSPPPCAISSDMQQTAYGYPHPPHTLHLALIAAPSATGRWCQGASYEGALYAVPHKPRCSGSYPCTGSRAESGPCWQVNGHPVCGVVVRPPEGQPKTQPTPSSPGTGPPGATYSYPGGLPGPVDRSSRVVAHFVVRFA